ncbi:hypothetical protein [Streptomyces sp. WAC04114]|uniref:hypothetical protein n=1 Tax=Streptomyces sp. WAC04114 TaxID=2867961 RepID=UPI001C8C2A66|nr:hypothetical protein [Streptomyces sp. WAC04114]MBX9363647.1 hypothetical protein [Streptomyces sp. WAC04114]
MAYWEAGWHSADTAETYAYLRLLNAVREQLPTAYEPDWAALRKRPTTQGSVPAAPAIPPQADTCGPKPRSSRRGAGWTDEEKDRLRTAFLAGTSLKEMTESLGRGEKALRWALYRLNLIPFPVDDVPAPHTDPKKEPKAYTVAEKRKTHPNAYEPWSIEDDQRLAERCAMGASLAELAQEFGRNQGGIASRLLKIDADGPAVEEAWEYGG